MSLARCIYGCSHFGILFMISFTNGHESAVSEWLTSLDRVEASSSPAPPYASASASAVSPPQSAIESPRLPSPAGIHSPRPVLAAATLSPQVTSPISDNKERDDLRSLMQDQARAIANLKAEKAALANSIDQLKQLESSECSLCLAVNAITE